MENNTYNTNGSYLAFSLNKENFVISVTQVLEIMELPKLTKVPNSSRFIRGIVNFRGNIVPVIDMHERLNMRANENASFMLIIINLEAGEKNIYLGLLVNQVNSVVEFETRDIQNAPDMGIKYNQEFLAGIVQIEQEYHMVLDPCRVFKTAELAESAY